MHVDCEIKMISIGTSEVVRWSVYKWHVLCRCGRCQKNVEHTCNVSYTLLWQKQTMTTFLFYGIELLKEKSRPHYGDAGKFCRVFFLLIWSNNFSCKGSSRKVHEDHIFVNKMSSCSFRINSWMMKWEKDFCSGLLFVQHAKKKNVEVIDWR